MVNGTTTSSNRITDINATVLDPVDLEYNKANQLTKVEFDDGAYETRYLYDADSGRLDQALFQPDGTQRKIEYVYNADGLVTQTTHTRITTKLKVAYEYDNLNRLVRETGHKTSPGTPSYEKWTYAAGDLNQVTTRTRATAEGNTHRWTYTYDATGNLTGALKEAFTTSWSETERWEYDWNPRDQMKQAMKYKNGSADKKTSTPRPPSPLTLNPPAFSQMGRREPKSPGPFRERGNRGEGDWERGNRGEGDGKEAYFAQEAFGNEFPLSTLAGDDWSGAEDDGVYERQTGKRLDPFTDLRGECRDRKF